MTEQKEMINLALKSGYSFKQVFGHLKDVIEKGIQNNTIGIADAGNTFAFYELETLCKKQKIKPIYGIRLTVVKDATKEVKPRGQFGCEYIFLAKNQEGVKEIYALTKVFYDNFYWRGNLSFHADVAKISDNVIVIADDIQTTKRLDYLAITQSTPKYVIEAAREESIPFVAIQKNWYVEKDDHSTYELMIGVDNGPGRPNAEKRTHPQHILTTEEWIGYQRHRNYVTEEEIQEAVANTHVVADLIEEYDLPRAPMIKSKSNKSIDYLCKIGAKKRGIDITQGVYGERYEREIKLIKEREFDDYFIVVADMISKAKQKMLVGPSRGSSAGSLVCYLIGITEIDPIEYGLLFERFIDVNRKDLPDIDIDFPDSQRKQVIKQLTDDYGADQVKHVANISKMQPRGAINDFAKGLRISRAETEELKNAIIERSGGDSRAGYCMMDTFDTTTPGQEFIKKYPNIRNVERVERHPSHHSTHAAGMIVCNDPIHNYCGVNTRDDTIMADKYGAEYFNLLKIDALGLRTLSILQDCAKSVGMKHTDFYSLPIDDEKTLKLFDDCRLNGIFQFEGYSLMNLTQKMGIKEFNDIVAITALARPGALYSGGAARYIKYRLGEDEPVYYGELHKKVTSETFGIVIYQEQILNICREIGKMSWNDVNKVRKALSKSLGEEHFAQYKAMFMQGADENGYTVEQAEFIWGEVCYGGNYAFNKSHAVAYALVSYWTGYMKAHYPLEFVVACLNNEKDEESSIKILRDATTHDGIEYCPLDPDLSDINWSVANGKVLGGLMNLHGIGIAKARKIKKMRTGEEKWTPAIVNKLANPVTPFDILYPCDHFWGDIYRRPHLYGLSHPPSLIQDVIGSKGEHFCFIGKLKNKNVRDMNEYVNVQKRGGKLVDGPALELALKLEDDTDSIMAEIGRFEFKNVVAT